MKNDSFTIPATHPCLAGHFPGDPVVPAVVLLDHVFMCLKKNGLEVELLNQAKFLKPVRAGQTIKVELTADGACIGYYLRHKDELIASGQITARTIQR